MHCFYLWPSWLMPGISCLSVVFGHFVYMCSMFHKDKKCLLFGFWSDLMDLNISNFFLVKLVYHRDSALHIVSICGNHGSCLGLSVVIVCLPV